MTEYTFTRQLRLLTGGDFQRVFNNVTLKVPDRHILLLASPNGLDHPRLGFVISKKNVRRAVKRNRVRRIMRESFRLNQHNLPPVDILVMARQGIDDLEKDELNRLAKKCWSRLRKKAKQASN